MPFKSKYPTPYQVLGIEDSATEIQIRASYRSRARNVHPDKVSSEGVEKATADFQELVAAFEACLNLLDTTDPQALYKEWECTDPTAWEKNYTYSLGSDEQSFDRSHWWDADITMDDPLALREWAKMSKKMHLVSRTKMTRTERVLLNWEYEEARKKFCAWKSTVLEEDEKAKLIWKQNWELNEREFRNFLFHLRIKQEEEPKLFDRDGCEDEDDEHLDEKKSAWWKHPGCGTARWLDKSEQLRERTRQLKVKQKQLSGFHRQVSAFQARPCAVQQLHASQKAANRAETENRIRADISILRDEIEKDKMKAKESKFLATVERRLTRAVEEAIENGKEFDYGSVYGVENPSLFEEVFIQAETFAGR